MALMLGFEVEFFCSDGMKKWLCASATLAAKVIGRKNKGEGAISRSHVANFLENSAG
jgi:hypothetical protein